MMKPFLSTCLILIVAMTAPALAARSDWVESDAARFRLLLVEGEAGNLTGGLEIQMDPGWHTYWKVPGDAGVPPQLDFQNSENVAAVEVRYPAPERYDDGHSISVVYHDHIVIPFRVEPMQSDQPLTLTLDAFVGVCEAICIPVPLQISLKYDGRDDPLSKVTLNRFLERLPEEPVPGHFDIDRIWVEENDLHIEVTAPGSGDTDLFVEGPPDWNLGQPIAIGGESPNTNWILPLKGMPENGDLAEHSFNFVATSGHQAIEKTLQVAK